MKVDVWSFHHTEALGPKSCQGNRRVPVGSVAGEPLCIHRLIYSFSGSLFPFHGCKVGVSSVWIGSGLYLGKAQ
ncbi:hypothetical protein GN956_G1314 [Arapaima gigas]